MEIYRIRESFVPERHTAVPLSTNHLALLGKLITAEGAPLIRKFPKNESPDHYCLQVVRKAAEDYTFRTSYFVGVHWLIENHLPVFIEPKFDVKGKDYLLDYNRMLLSAFQHSDSLAHLSELLHVDFEQSPILIKQQDDLLSPLLIAQYLQVLKRLVRKGLRNSYYRVSENLHGKVKGKILVAQTMRENHLRNKFLDSKCSYEVFGPDSLENRILKKALSFSIHSLEGLKTVQTGLGELESIIRYVKPAFFAVGDQVDSSSIKAFRSNALFNEYSEALRLAGLILKRFGYSINKTTTQQVQTPPFWIDMSKLFELHLLSQLKKIFPEKQEVRYQENVNKRILDYLLCSKDGKIKMVIDAKYKDYSEKSSLDIEDIRQVSAYARMTGVYKRLGLMENGQPLNQTIDCLIVYPDLENGLEEITRKNIHDDLKSTSYFKLYTLGLKLPINPKKNP
ncbi:5-methylcytosine restriction system specificity protein McrC [Pedobacter agri]|uniref:5-methylcytosine restriction system specificity protein McrC n=1 Tax=Pedobacter agri TaxID=454586 RepID=UPI002931D864|nr:hypothetical protein [Pedobacter agri]